MVTSFPRLTDTVEKVPWVSEARKIDSFVTAWRTGRFKTQLAPDGTLRHRSIYPTFSTVSTLS